MMSVKTSVNLPLSIDREMVITRTFAAPRALVFKVWTDPVHLARWWGPHGWSVPHPVLEPVVGGAIDLSMRAPNGAILPNRGVIEEIVPPELLVYCLKVLEDDGSTRFQLMNTLTFAETAEGTEVTLHVEVVEATPAAAFNIRNMGRGWGETLEKLDAYLARLDG